jgi:hypothetical protein
MERGYRPNPVWSPGAMWNVQSAWLVAMESFVASVETFSQKKIKTPSLWIWAKSEKGYISWWCENAHQISNRLVKQFKSIAISKIQNGRRPAAAILDIFIIIWKVRVTDLLGPKLGSKFRKDRSSGLKVIAISKMLTSQCCKACNMSKSKMAA